MIGIKKLHLEFPADDKEHAYTICEQAGKMLWGAHSVGGHSKVNAIISCPTGSKPAGVIHSHPGGTTQPSEMDIREMQRLGLRHLCIVVPETREGKCYDLKLNTKR